MHNLLSSNRKRSYKGDQKGKEITNTASYRLRFIDTIRFVASSLSNLANSLAEGIHKIKCKFKLVDKNVKLAELNTKIVIVFLNTQ